MQEDTLTLTTQGEEILNPTPQEEAIPTLVNQPPQGMTMTVEILDSAKAQELLTHNLHNRALSLSTSKVYANDMVQGKWLPSMDPIRFDWNGMLQDGQHRLNALVQAAKVVPSLEVPFLLIRGLDPKNFSAMDTGKNRKASDNLSILKVPNHSLAAPTLGIFGEYAVTGRINQRKLFGNPGIVGLYESLSEEDRNLLQGSITLAKRPKETYSATSLLAAIGFAAGVDHAEKFESFCTELLDMTGLASNSPVAALNRKCMHWVKNPTRWEEIAAITIKAFNAYVAGVGVSGLKWSTSEPFPVIISTRDLEPVKNLGLHRVSSFKKSTKVKIEKTPVVARSKRLRKRVALTTFV